MSILQLEMTKTVLRASPGPALTLLEMLPLKVGGRGSCRSLAVGVESRRLAEVVSPQPRAYLWHQDGVMRRSVARPRWGGNKTALSITNRQGYTDVEKLLLL